MTLKALVVDDDPNILEIVGDILKSLGHKFDTASCQEEARRLLADNQYAYHLVDLELPVVANRGLPRIQNGENLVREIIRQRGARREPVIIMTGHGTNGPELAVRMMKLGADDFVTKPFPASGNTLDKAILEALGGGASEKASGNGLGPHSVVCQPQQFEGGNLTFYPDPVELCGVKVCGGRRSGLIRRVLDVLRTKTPQGRFVALSGTELGIEVGCSGDQNKIAGCIRDFRRNTRQLLLSEAKVQCGLQDVIQSGGTGYRLHEWIDVQDVASPVARIQGHDGPAIRGDDPVNDPVNSNDDPLNRAGGPVIRRREWILGELRKGRRLRAPAIATALKCSCTTAKRDLETLRAAGHVAFVGASKTGFYQTTESVAFKSPTVRSHGVGSESAGGT